MSGRTELQPTWSASQLQSGQLLETPDTLRFQSLPLVTLVQAATVTPDADLGSLFELSATTNAAIAVASPTGTPKNGQLLTLIVFNVSGGAMGAISLGADFDQVNLTEPADTTHRAYQFQWDGTKWRFLVQTGADVPN